jgi:hypothetical protein
MLETTKTSQATSLMRELLETHTRRAAGSPLFLKASVTLSGDWVDGVVTACLRDFWLIDKTLAVAPASIKVNSGPVTCVTPTATSVVLQQRRDADQRLLIQEAVGEAPAKMDRKSSELFVGGSFHSATAATDAFANWHLLGEIISPEYERSEMKKALDNWVTNFHGPSGREWAQRYASYHQLTLNLVTNMSDIVAQFMAIAKDPTNRLAAADQVSPVHPRFYQEATLFAATLETDLFHAITRGLGKGYIDMPVVVKQLPFFAAAAHVAAPGAAHDGRPNDVARNAHQRAPAQPNPAGGRGPHQQREGGPQGRGAANAGGPREAGCGADDAAARDDNKQQGFLVMIQRLQEHRADCPLQQPSVTYASTVPYLEFICHLSMTKAICE